MKKKRQILNPKILMLTALAATLLAVPVSNVFALTDTDTMTVSATVGDSCDIIANNLAFGTYDPVVTHKTVHLDVNTTIDVTCTDGLEASISLDDGANAVTGQSYMKAAGSTDTLEYEIYRETGRTSEWNATNLVTTTGTGVAQTYTAYGRIPSSDSVTAQKNASKDSYTDTVTATVTF